jgi:hypothetical protein
MPHDPWDELEVKVKSKDPWEELDTPPSSWQESIDQFGKKYIKPVANAITFGGIGKLDEAFEQAEKPGLDNKLGAAAKGIQATLQAVGPGAIGKAGLAAASAGKVLPFLGHTLGGLALGTAADVGVNKAATALGAGEGTADLAGTVAGLIPVGAVGAKAYQKFLRKPRIETPPVTVTVPEEVPLVTGGEGSSVEAPSIEAPVRIPSNKPIQLPFDTSLKANGKVAKAPPIPFSQVEEYAVKNGITEDEALKELQKLPFKAEDRKVPGWDVEDKLGKTQQDLKLEEMRLQELEGPAKAERERIKQEGEARKTQTPSQEDLFNPSPVEPLPEQANLLPNSEMDKLPNSRTEYAAQLQKVKGLRSNVRALNRDLTNPATVNMTQEPLWTNAWNPDEEALAPVQAPNPIKDYYTRLRTTMSQDSFQSLPNELQQQVKDSVKLLESKLPAQTRREVNRFLAKQRRLSPSPRPKTETVTVTDGQGQGEKLYPKAEGSPLGKDPIDDFNNQYIADQKAIEEAGKSRIGVVGKASKRVIDSFHILESLMAKYYHVIPPQKNASDRIDDVLRSDTMGNAMFDEGMGGFIKNFFKTPEELRGGSQYVLDSRLVDLFERGLLSKYPESRDIQGVPGSGYKRAKERIEATKGLYEPFRVKYTEYANKLLTMLHNEGLITDDIYNNSIKEHGEYVILRRIFDGDGVLDLKFQEAPGSVVKQNIVKELEHGGREVAFEDPIGLLAGRSRNVMKTINRNKLGKLVAEYAGVLGEEGKTVLPEIKEIVKVNPAPKSNTDGVNEFSFVQDGKRVVLETIPELASAMKLLEKGQGDAALDYLAKIARVSKALITGLNPIFALMTNPVVDQASAVLNMEGGAKGVLNHFAAFPKAFMSVLTRGKDYDALSGRGALGSSYDIYRGNPTDTIERVWASKNVGRKAAWLADHFRNPKKYGGVKKAVETAGGRNA